MAAVEITNADAVHPKLWILAENAEFAEICKKSAWHQIYRPTLSKSENGVTKNH